MRLGCRPISYFDGLHCERSAHFWPRSGGPSRRTALQASTLGTPTPFEAPRRPSRGNAWQQPGLPAQAVAENRNIATEAAISLSPDADAIHLGLAAGTGRGGPHGALQLVHPNAVPRGLSSEHAARHAAHPNGQPGGSSALGEAASRARMPTLPPRPRAKLSWSSAPAPMMQEAAPDDGTAVAASGLPAAAASGVTLRLPPDTRERFVHYSWDGSSWASAPIVRCKAAAAGDVSAGGGGAAAAAAPKALTARLEVPPALLAAAQQHATFPPPQGQQLWQPSAASPAAQLAGVAQTPAEQRQQPTLQPKLALQYMLSFDPQPPDAAALASSKSSNNGSSGSVGAQQPHPQQPFQPGRAAPLGAAVQRHAAQAVSSAAAGPAEAGSSAARLRLVPGASYVLPEGGSSSGRSVTPPQLLLHRPVLLATGLSSLVGRQGSAVDEEACRAFMHAWQRGTQAHPSLLVYNTSRLWRSFQQVWAARQHVLPEPDVLILGQGTRIMYQTPSHLQEDLQWRLKLDAGWSRPAMEAAVAACVQRHGRKALRYAPGGEQNNHRLALLLDAAQLDALSAELRASLRGRKAGKARLGYRMVVRQARPAGSGSGSGLLAVDLVPALAGKGAALQHVMRRFHIPRQSVVAVGSGSQDVSLLEQASHAIIAGRADPVLEDWARQQRAQQPASASGRSPAPWGQGASDAGHAARVGSAQQQQQQQWHRQQPQHGTSVDAPGPTVVVLSRQLGALGLLEGLEQLRSIES